jgi:hypothetical protein
MPGPVQEADDAGADESAAADHRDARAVVEVGRGDAGDAVGGRARGADCVNAEGVDVLLGCDPVEQAYQVAWGRDCTITAAISGASSAPAQSELLIYFAWNAGGNCRLICRRRPVIVMRQVSTPVGMPKSFEPGLGGRS